MFSKDDTRDDHDAIKKEFALLETTLNPFHPYIPACGDSENEKESDEEERLKVVGSEPFCTDELASHSTKAGAKSDHETTTVHVGSLGLDCRTLVPPNSTAFL